MSTRDTVAKMLLAVAKLNLPGEESSKTLLNIVDPKPAPCGFTRTVLAIICPCGASLGLDMIPEPMDEEEVAEAKKKIPEMEVVDNRPEGSSQKEAVIATSHGETDHECPACHTRFVLAWEVHAASIAKGLKLPWEEPEIPAPPSSGQSMTTANDSETVH